jgi:phosphatidate cytidylyltransferase
MFLNRLLTALVAIPLIIIIVVYGGTVGVFSIVSLVVLLGLYEYLSFLYEEHLNIQIVTHILLGLVLTSSFFFGFPELVVPALAGVFVLMMAFSLLRVDDPRKKAENLFVRSFGVMYVAFLLSFLIPLSDLASGIQWVLLAIAINFASDAGGYFAGRFLGKHKLYPVVSPKKTVEGAVGSVLGCILGIIVCKYIFFGALGLWDVLILGIGGSILAILGDLVESLFKRGFKVKDAGGLLPGHGGFLDRIDSVVFSIPFIYYYAALIFTG